MAGLARDSTPGAPSLDSRIRRGLRATLAVHAGPSHGKLLAGHPGLLSGAERRGYLSPEEDHLLRVRYAQYLAERASLVAVLDSLEPECGRGPDDWARCRPAFVTALAAASLLLVGTRRLRRPVMHSRLLRKALDERDPLRGVPAKSFARLYRATTSPRRLLRLHAAHRWFETHRDECRPPALPAEFAALLPIIEGLDLGPSREDIWRDRLRYRWFSFRRRHHSAWKRSLFEVFRWSGSLIADLHQPGVKPPGAPKSVTPELRRQVLARLEPGDVVVTRHEDALSNLFLPGFWPHASLYLGDAGQRARLGLGLPAGAPSAAGPHFLEARKDGVRIRPADDTLAVDALVVLRPPLEPTAIRTGLENALEHWGKLYDFVFDFRRSERLACTEVVYRGLDGVGGLHFQLEEVGGRLCLPAEELIGQALDQQFRIIATAGIGRAGFLTGRDAELALHATRTGL